MGEGIKVDTPYHFVGRLCDWQPMRGCFTVKFNLLPASEYNWFKRPRTQFPEAPGAVVLVFGFTIDEQDRAFFERRLAQIIA